MYWMHLGGPLQGGGKQLQPLGQPHGPHGNGQGQPHGGGGHLAKSVFFDVCKY